MSFEALRNAITGRMEEMRQDADTAQQEARIRLLGPVDERPNVVTLDKALALRDSDPDAFATLPAEMRRQALDHAQWRTTHPKTTSTGGDAA